MTILFREALLSVSTSFFEEVDLGSDEVKVGAYSPVQHLKCWAPSAISFPWLVANVDHRRRLVLEVLVHCASEQGTFKIVLCSTEMSVKGRQHDNKLQV